MIYSDIESRQAELSSQRKQLYTGMQQVIHSPEGTTFTFGTNGETYSRIGALGVISSQFSNLLEYGTSLSHYERTVKKYESGGFLVDISKTGDLIFSEPSEKEVGDYLVGWSAKRRGEYEKKGLGFAKTVGDISFSFLQIFDVGTWVSAYEGKLPSYLAEKHYRDVMSIQKGSPLSVWYRRQKPSYENIILPLVVGTGIGMGIGAFKATSIGSKALLTVGSKTLTVGGAVEGVIAGYSTYEIGKAAVENPLRTGISLAITAPTAILGYRTGASIGYGRAEAWLYGRSTFKPGSVEFIRFKEALRISRSLQYVKSGYAKPLDFAKDIMRLKPNEAGRVLSFLQSQPKAVVGGSAASYTQISPKLWSYYRKGVKPRDIDLLVKDVYSAEKYFGRLAGGNVHKVDIHGFDFAGKGGRYYRFGFRTQSPKIGYVLGGKKLQVRGLTGKYGEVWGRTWKINFLGKLRGVKDTKTSIVELDPFLFSLKGKSLSFSKTVLKHELIHQKYPWMSEKMVLAMERKGFIPELYYTASRYFEGGTSTIRLPTKAKFLTLGEQVFRKGLGGTTLETGYRWFKDIPDFVMTSEQLIGSAKHSWNPLNWFRAKYAAKHLEIFKHPIVQPKTYITKPSSVFSKTVNRYIKPGVTPEVVPLGGGYVDYMYPSYVYPSKYTSFTLSKTGYGISSEYKPASYQYKSIMPPSSIIPTSYISNKIFSYIPPSINIKTISSYKGISKKPQRYISTISYKPIGIPNISIPKYYPPSKPPSYKPPTKPSIIPIPPVETYEYEPLYEKYFVRLEPPKLQEIFLDKQKKIKMPKEFYKIGYKFRKFRVVDLFKDIKIGFRGI